MVSAPSWPLTSLYKTRLLEVGTAQLFIGFPERIPLHKQPLDKYRLMQDVKRTPNTINLANTQLWISPIALLQHAY